MKLPAIKKAFWSLALTLLVSAACTAQTPPGQILVFAAASLTDAFDEIGEAFEQANPGKQVLFNFASSSTLAAQLLEGAPADVFASANQIQMQNVVDGGLINQQPALFLSNRLVIIVPADNPASIQSYHDLAKSGLVLVLAAPGAPIREYSDQVIINLGDEDYRMAVYANLASEEETVRVVVTRVALGEADAGMVYTSDVTPEVAGQLQQIAIPDEANVIAAYPIAPMDMAPDPAGAQAFVDFVLSPEGQAILQKWGFGSPP